MSSTIAGNIRKIYITSFLTGMMFWYAVEKLFMQHIGIDAKGIGVVTMIFSLFILVFDLPVGWLTDRWGRKNVMLVSLTSKLLCSVLMGVSASFAPFLVGYLVYALYSVTSNGTLQALLYDTLYDMGHAGQYSKVAGRVKAISLTGAGIANISSGFITNHFGYNAAFYWAAVPCALALIIWTTIKEPTRHKPEQRLKIITQWRQATRSILGVPILRSLTIVMTALAVVELFKTSFGQLYMLRYVSSVQMIGLLWAAFAATWALGSLIAHRLHARINALIVATVLPLVLMAFIDNWFSLVLFMFQAVAAAALLNHIETQIQHATSSAVRASVLSTVSTLSTAISIPASFAIGWLIRNFNAFTTLRIVAAIGVTTLLYWFAAAYMNRRSKAFIAAEA